MTATYRYDVEVLHLLVSPGHAYFGRARDGAADVATADVDRVELVADAAAVVAAPAQVPQKVRYGPKSSGAAAV